ncbi:hypothetical protein [Mesorhizobium captivum]|uniref:hypothetical protein n=1 Tax=Mesorhizobium captivum TaxID=3072319 RepID=UPI002A23FCDD|nr:hypothetical protein [Mesorhizobium sp. VK22E]MDX8506133.1 hypothetical protein [Mesorhizobium sp. VK22E]
MLHFKFPALTNVARGLHHLIVWQRIEGTENSLRRELPVLYICHQDGRPPELVQGMLEFSKAHASRSATWHLYRLRAVGALIDYVAQCWPWFQGQNRDRARKLFRAFVEAMVKGTIQVKDGQLTDGSGLYWLSSNVREVERRMEALRDVARWMDTEGYGYGLANAVLPEIPSEPSGVLAFLYTSQVVKRISLLDYLSPHKSAKPLRSRNLFGRPGSKSEAIFAFPDDRVEDLLRYGFPNDFSGMLNSMFMLGGGLRESEGLHVWVSDIQHVEGEAVLYLYHPSDAWIDDPSGQRVTRRRYLMDRFNRVPRSDLLKGPEAVGWKGLRGDINGAFVHWLPGSGFAQAIAAAVRVYMRTVRDPLMRIRRHMGLPDHPYLLVSTGAMGGGSPGDPYTITAFRSSWRRAVPRAYSAANLEIPDIVKRNGLTEHACRHRYAQNLVALKLDGALIQQCMRQVNPFSHIAYLQRTASETSALLEAAAENAPRPDWSMSRFLSTTNALLSERDRRHGLL